MRSPRIVGAGLLVAVCCWATPLHAQLGQKHPKKVPADSLLLCQGNCLSVRDSMLRADSLRKEEFMKSYLRMLDSLDQVRDSTRRARWYRKYYPYRQWAD